MCADKVKGENEKPEEPQNLSATAMFLRGFDSSSSAGSAAAKSPESAQPFDFGELAASPFAKAPSQTPAEPRIEPQLESRVEPRAPAASAPGEFTRMFQTAGGQGSSPSSGSEAVKPSPSAPAGNPGPASAPGEFTRIFVSGHTPPASAPAPKSNEPSQPAAGGPGAGSRSKGFSSPGLSDSASGEGGFTQFFQAAQGQPSAPVKPNASTFPSTPPPVAPQHAPLPWQEPSISGGASSSGAGPSV